MKKNTAFITILLIAVVVAAVLSIRLFVGQEAPEPTPTQTIRPPVTETPAPPVTETPVPPAGTETPVQTPEPTEPQETPGIETRPPLETDPPETPEPISVSGSFRSDTGTWLNIVADWSAASDAEGKVQLTLTVSADHYSLFTGALASAVELNVNGEVYKASSAEIQYDGSARRVTPLASFTVEAPLGNVPVSVTWHYNGRYSGVELTDIVASDVLSIG